MEKSGESQEGGNDEASQQHAKKTKHELPTAQPCPSKLLLETVPS